MTQQSRRHQRTPQSPNRRNFIRNMGIAGAALGAATTTPLTHAQSVTQPTDIDILNFALNLEYLEAEFYTVAVTGQSIAQAGLTVTGAGTAGATVGGAQITFVDPEVQAVAAELAMDEQKHVALLQGAIASLGGKPIAKPAINLSALGLGFQNMAVFLALARVFEDIGVSAYGGAAPMIQNNSILGYAARILATEAFHSGNIRAQIARLGIPTIPAVDGADILPPPSGTLFFPTDSNALAEVRTPAQVLYLAYAGATSATSGGFFPNGVNGNINTSAATPATGVEFTATPNPIHVASAGMPGQTTLSWNAPAAQIIQIHVGSPTGPEFTDNFNSGSMTTGPWVTNGMTFYLQDVSNGNALTAANTLATLTVNVVTP